MRIVIEAFMYTVNMLNYNLFLMRIVIDMTLFWNATEAFMIYSKHVEIKYKYNLFLMKIVIYDRVLECHRSIHVYTVNILKYKYNIQIFSNG